MIRMEKNIIGILAITFLFLGVVGILVYIDMRKDKSMIKDYQAI